MFEDVVRFVIYAIYVEGNIFRVIILCVGKDIQGSIHVPSTPHRILLIYLFEDVRRSGDPGCSLVPPKPFKTSLLLFTYKIR